MKCTVWHYIWIQIYAVSWIFDTAYFQDPRRKMNAPVFLKTVRHYSGVIMGALGSQIASLTIVYSTVYSGTDQRKHQSSASRAFLQGMHKWPVTRKMFPFGDVIKVTSIYILFTGEPHGDTMSSGFLIWWRQLWGKILFGAAVRFRYNTTDFLKSIYNKQIISCTCGWDTWCRLKVLSLVSVIHVVTISMSCYM